MTDTTTDPTIEIVTSAPTTEPAAPAPVATTPTEPAPPPPPPSPVVAVVQSPPVTSIAFEEPTERIAVRDLSGKLRETVQAMAHMIGEPLPADDDGSVERAWIALETKTSRVQISLMPHGTVDVGIGERGNHPARMRVLGSVSASGDLIVVGGS